MKVKINNEEYDFVLNWGSRYAYEEITDKPLILTKSHNAHLLMFCILLFNNQETFKYSFDEFRDIIEDYTLEEHLQKVLVEEIQRKIPQKEEKAKKDTKKKN